MNSREPRRGSGPSRAAWERAARARQRAARATERAEHHEAMDAVNGGEHHASTAAVYRRLAERHLSSARLQETYARRAEQWSAGAGRSPKPRFMEGVAESCGAESAALALLGADWKQLAVAFSDSRAEQAQELEFVLDEGPGRDAARGGTAVQADRLRLDRTWPYYGPGVAALGVHEVLSVPLIAPDVCLGALILFNSRARGLRREPAAGIADALTHGMLLGPDADPELYGDADHRDRVQLAAGMVSVQANCEVQDALALIKARAFTDAVPSGEIARAVIDRELRLDPDAAD